jgi:hypothetical protein
MKHRIIDLYLVGFEGYENVYECLLHAGFSLLLLFSANDGGDMFPRIFLALSPDCTALYATRSSSSYI